MFGCGRAAKAGKVGCATGICADIGVAKPTRCVQGRCRGELVACELWISSDQSGHVLKICLKL